MDENLSRSRRLRTRASAMRQAAEGTVVGTSVRRVRELELGSCALVLAAQQVMCLIPLLVVLAALRASGTSGNFGVRFGHYLGVSRRATQDLGAVFAGPAQVRSAVTVLGVLLLVLFTVGLAQAHQRAYELAWRLERSPRGSWLRQARWVAGAVGYVVALTAIIRALGGLSSERVVFIAICAPLTAGFYWWSQRVLLGGRVSWRSLLPGALLIAFGVTLLLVLTPLGFSGQITSSVREFGPIGVTFVLATWQLVLSVLIVGGAAIGAGIVSHSRGDR
jgi:membrane protein